MDSFLKQLDNATSRTSPYDLSTTTILSYTIALLFLIHQVLYKFDIASLSIQDALWNTLVYITPSYIALDAQQRKELGSQAVWSQRHAAKSESMRRALGIGSQALMQQVPGAAGIARRFSMARNTIDKSDAPSGLGNWDNSCYQNSVLQGLTSLGSLQSFLSRWSTDKHLPEHSTLEALRETTNKLRDPSNNGRHIWTPAKLKSMSSWQQQDAQEYFSKIMDELDKDVGKAQKASGVLDGLETAGKDKTVLTGEVAASLHNPLEGLLSQRVACTACGFSEGLSMIPFNCLTVPLGEYNTYNLEQCLDEYTKLEPIMDVECAKCTLLKAQRDLLKMTDLPKESLDPDVKKLLQLPPEVRAQAMQRLQEVQRALDEDDFSDETLKQKCQISKNTRVTSTKTRQALIGRAPQSLIVHVNRSVFDELTGMQRKNYANVRYPAMLDLGPWILGSQSESHGIGLPREDMWKYIYRLKAIVTHYGRHENGHYIAFRQSLTDDEKQQWWQLSDEEVSLSSEDDVLGQGNVFMLFYERTYDYEMPTTEPPKVDLSSQVESDDKMLIDSVVMDASEEEPHTAQPRNDLLTLSREPEQATQATQDLDMAPSEASTTEDEAEVDDVQPVARIASPASPIMMRTANVDRSNDHWNVSTFIAAT